MLDSVRRLRASITVRGAVIALALVGYALTLDSLFVDPDAERIDPGCRSLLFTPDGARRIGWDVVELDPI